MNQWMRFFVGTPRRLVTTASMIGLATVIVFPGLLRTAAERLVGELNPLLGPLLAIVIVFAALRLILFGRK